MKKGIFILLAISLLFFTGCVKKHVFYPLPVTFTQTVTITTTNSNFNGQVSFPAFQISQEVQDQLNSIDDATLNNILLEGIAFTVVSTNSPASVLNGNLNVTYAGNGPLPLLTINNLSFGQILNQPQTLPLSDNAVQLIVDAFRDIVNSGQTQDILLDLNGNVNPVPGGGLTFELQIDLTADVVVAQCQDVFDLLGSDDPECQ